MVVLDNVGLHQNGYVRERRGLLRRHGIRLVFLPPYAPKLNEIEAILRRVKYEEMPERSYSELDELLAAVDAGFRRVRADLKK